MNGLKDFVLEWGELFPKREYVKAESESALEAELMRTRPEIFPVNIIEVMSQEELDRTADEVPPCAA